MKHIASILLAVVCAAAAAGVASAAAGGNDLAVGHGTINRFPPFVANFDFAAESGPLGEKARGFYRQTLYSPDGTLGDLRGRVTCLLVTGNTATVGGVWEESTLSFIHAGWSFWLEARDTDHEGIPDSMTFVFTSDIPGIEFGPDFPDSCLTPFFSDPFGLIPLLTGNIVVHDGGLTLGPG
jgi:hypothetical protein